MRKEIIFNNTYELLKKACSEFKNKIALRFIPSVDQYTKNIEFTYDVLFQMINKTVRALGTFNLHSNDTISWILPSCPEAYFCFWAAEAMGINHPINPEYPVEDIVEITRQVNSRLLILPDPDLFPGSNAIKEAISLKNPGCKIIMLSELQKLTQEQDSSLVETLKKPSDRCIIFSTSATTAKPKLMAFTHRNRLLMTEMLVSRFKFNEQDNLLVGLPLFHVGAATLYNATAFSVGATVTLMGPTGWLNPDLPSNFWHIVKEYKGTHSAALPFTYIKLLHTPINADINPLKSLLTGMPMERSLFVGFMEKLQQKVDLIHIYGSTESGCIITTNTDRNPITYRSLGSPLEGQALKICIFENGNYVRDAGPDELGMICIQGENIGEYLNVPSAFFQDGRGATWFKTNDMGSYDQQGQHWFKCRAQDLLYRNEQPISCFDIDLILSKHPDITNVGVIPSTSETEGQVPVAFVSLKTSGKIDADNIKEWFLSQGYSKEMLPSEIHFMDTLPINGLGKVIKPLLVEMHAARSEEKRAITLS